MREREKETNDRDKCQWHYWNLVFVTHRRFTHVRKILILIFLGFIHSVTHMSHISSCVSWRSEENDRQTADLFFFNVLKRTKCILFITLSVPVHCRMNMYECALILFTRDLKISFCRSTYSNMALISFIFFSLSLSLTVIVFDHRIVDTYIDSSFLSLSYFCACVVKAITIRPD